MNINIKLNKNFTTQYNKLQERYGTEIAKINGFDDNQLSYTDFIDNFIDETNVADSSIDGNSNVSHKDMVSLLAEMPKPHEKLLAFNKIYYELQKKYGFQVANNWLEAEWVGKLYMHDANTSTFKHYCFKGDTKILTKEGVKELKELDGKQIMVLNKNHGWEDATVKHFGRAVLRKLILERYGVNKELYVTGNHLWFVKNNKGITEIATDNLKVGMKIPFNTSKVWSQVNPSPFGVAHGFFIGDGFKGEHMRANFCGDKIALLPYFTPAKINGTKEELTTIGIPNNYKKLPSLDESASYLYGWLSGYFAADGNVDEKGRCTISSTKKENLEFVRNVLCVLGMPVNEIRYQDRISNLTNEMGRVYVLTLTSEYLKEDFFIRPFHKENFAMSTEKNDRRKDRSWIVKSVEDTGVEDDVYCAVVNGTQSFTLDNNILTHNCFAYDLKDLAEKGLYFLGNNFNAEPAKHLTTFVDFVKEFIGYASNRSSGAVGLPNLIPYMYYFYKQDIANDYMGIKTSHTEQKYAEQEFQRFIYAVNQPYVRDGQQSAFTNTTIFDHPYFEALFGGSSFPDGSFMIDSEEEIINFQKIYMKVMSDIRHHNMFTFPVSTISLLRQNGKFVDEEFAKWSIKHNMEWSDSNIFVDSSVNSLSNCCRLKSNIKDLGYFNSVGGTALKVGSIKVNTINLARIALDTNTEDEYLEELKKRTILTLQSLDVLRHILQRNVEKGLLPNFSNGLVDFKHLYNTIGFIGIYETMKKFGYIKLDEFGNTFYTDNASNFGKKIFDTMHNTADEFIKNNNCDYMINTEQIPAESAAAKLMKKDKFFYPNANIYDLPLYGNQFIPLGIQTTGQERVRIQSLFDGFCNGGSILHYNINAPFDNFDKAWKMVNYIADQGVTYFAFNTKIQACKHNHAFYGKICPICGEPADTEYSRIVGFYTATKVWSKERQSEYKMRKWDNKE